MNYIEFQNAFKDFTVFSLQDIKQLDSHFYRARLNEWQDKGYISKIIKGFYTFSNLKLNEHLLFEIANKIYSPSYVSLETALSFYHFITESIYRITSVSTRRTCRFESSIVGFTFQTVKPHLYFGYELVQNQNKYYKIASPEKAILDYFYLNPHLKNENDFASLRINENLFFEQVNEKKLTTFLNKFSQKTLTERVRKFWKFYSRELEE